jgi:hypothetical protein
MANLGAQLKTDHILSARLNANLIAAQFHNELVPFSTLPLRITAINLCIHSPFVCHYVVEQYHADYTQVHLADSARIYELQLF